MKKMMQKKKKKELKFLLYQKKYNFETNYVKNRRTGVVINEQKLESALFQNDKYMFAYKIKTYLCSKPGIVQPLMLATLSISS